MSATRRDFLAWGGAALLTAPALGRWPGAAAPHAQPGVVQQPAAFAPPIGVCGGSKEVASWKAGGAEYLEVGCRGELAPDKALNEMSKALDALRDAPLPARAANSFLPGSFVSVGPKADHAPILAYAEQAFLRAARVGIRVITFGSAGARMLPEGWAREDADLQFTALLARLGDVADRHGVDLCVENLQAAECNFLNRIGEARRLVAAVGHPRIGLTADVFHMLRMEEGPQAIREAGALVRHVHLAEKRERTAPGVDGDDFTPYLQALKDAGFTGRISLECGWSDVPAQLPKALATLRQQLAAVA